MTVSFAGPGSAGCSDFGVLASAPFLPRDRSLPPSASAWVPAEADLSSLLTALAGAAASSFFALRAAELSAPLSLSAAAPAFPGLSLPASFFGEGDSALAALCPLCSFAAGASVVVFTGASVVSAESRLLPERPRCPVSAPFADSSREADFFCAREAPSESAFCSDLLLSWRDLLSC